MEFLSFISALINIIRPKNLIIIALTQWILHFFIIIPFVGVPSLNAALFYLLVVDTMFIAAGGYLINDILDYKTDVINKPLKLYIPKPLSLKTAWVYYFCILISGFLTALYIAYKINNLPLVLIYPLACVVLYFYSAKLKNSVLAGNIVVSLFVAFVSGIVLFAERNSVSNMAVTSSYHVVMGLFTAYMIFSFLINLLREIIKDIEDFEGDIATGVITYAGRYGITRAKKLCMGLCILTIIIAILWVCFSSVCTDFRVQTYITLFVVCPILIVLQILTKTSAKRDFSKISTILKWVMVAGLGSIILISSVLKLT